MQRKSCIPPITLQRNLINLQEGRAKIQRLNYAKYILESPLCTLGQKTIILGNIFIKVYVLRLGPHDSTTKLIRFVIQIQLEIRKEMKAVFIYTYESEKCKWNEGESLIFPHSAHWRSTLAPLLWMERARRNGKYKQQVQIGNWKQDQLSVPTCDLRIDFWFC